MLPAWVPPRDPSSGRPSAQNSSLYYYQRHPNGYLALVRYKPLYMKYIFRIFSRMTVAFKSRVNKNFRDSSCTICHDSAFLFNSTLQKLKIQKLNINLSLRKQFNKFQIEQYIQSSTAKVPRANNYKELSEGDKTINNNSSNVITYHSPKRWLRLLIIMLVWSFSTHTPKDHKL